MEEEKTDEVILSIRGKEIRYEYRLVDISDIRFHRNNPRIASILAGHEGVLEDSDIDRVLWERDETHKLKRAIEKDGGLIHPILVYKKEVLEGNTRLCCYRHLYNETKDKKWFKIKCHVILDPLTQNDIYRLLCTEHIEGKNPWEPYEKANLYRKMKVEEGMTLDQISELVGESTATIGYRIRAFELMVKNSVDDKSRYSHFEQLVRNRGIQEISQHDHDIEKKVVDLIVSGRVGQATDIRRIPDIHKHKEARKRLFGGKENLEQIYVDLKAKAPMTDSALMKQVEELIKRVQSLERGERDAIRVSDRDRRKVEQLTKELIDLCRELEIKFHIPKNMRK